jgi:hypothetical protein
MTLSATLSTTRTCLCAAFLALTALSACGCGYAVGNSYHRDITSVCVPVFTTDDYRRGPEFQLTEAVQKQIQQRTPFRLVSETSADTKLTGKIVHIQKMPLDQTRYNDSRELQVQYRVNVTWEDLRTGRILAQQNVSLDPDVVHLMTTGDFAPEVGQSLATATQQAMEKMARQIVDMMQAPW